MRVSILLFLTGVIVLAPLFGCSSPEDRREAADAASARGTEARSKPYVASVLREPFHRSTCKWAKKINDENIVGYDTRKEAIEDGHRPCKVCRP